MLTGAFKDRASYDSFLGDHYSPLALHVVLQAYQLFKVPLSEMPP